MLLLHNNNRCRKKSECYVKLILLVLLIPAFDKKLHHFVQPEQTAEQESKPSVKKTTDETM